MAFRDVLGHTLPILLLQNAIQADRVVHSYLFTGNEGVGKKWVALQFAKALNCLQRSAPLGEACDQCLSCRKIDGGLHPDVLVIEPEHQAVKVDQVREMQRMLAYRPYEGYRRVCILDGADRMAPFMSNALLKTLEETPLHTVIILIATHSRLLPPTILSRCQSIRFHPLPISLVSQWLVDRKEVQDAEAHLLASLSEGSLGKALALQEELQRIPRKDLLTEWVGRRTFSFQEMETWAHLLPSDRESLVSLLEMAKTLLRDLVVLNTTGSAFTLMHSDLQRDLVSTGRNWTLPALLKRIDALHRTLQAISPIRGNANTQLALEAMMLSWAEG